MTRLVLAGIGLVAATGAATGFLFLSVEKASVRITVPARSVDASAVLHGATTGGQFKTERVEATRTETAQGSATGVAASPATYASGYVVFHYSCSNPSCTPNPAQAGREVCALNPSGPGAKCWSLLTAVTCFCGESVPVQARWPGPQFNSGAHTVNYMEWMNSTGESVDNPAPISGAANATSSPVVQQSDLDAVTRPLTDQVTVDLRSAFPPRKGNIRYLVDGSPSLNVSSDATAGARTGTFHVTVSGSLGATAFDEGDARALLAEALADTVPRGYKLVGPPVITDLTIQDSDANGNVTVTGRATGRLTTKLDAEALRSKLRGLDFVTARRTIEAVAPGSAVEILGDPMMLPWLPLNTDRISVVVVAHAVPSLRNIFGRPD